MKRVQFWFREVAAGWGGGNADFDLQASIPLAATKAVDTRPGQGTFQLNDPRVLVPGDPARSMILKRMQLTTLGRMPHIASKVVDDQGVNLIHDWIAELKADPQLNQPGAIHPRRMVP